MIKTFRKPLMVLATFGSVSVLPMFSLVACTPASESQVITAPITPANLAEDAAIKAIVNAPDVPSANDEALLSVVKALAVSKQGNAADLTTFLLANKPSVAAFDLAAHASVLILQMRQAWRVTSTSPLSLTTLTQLLDDLGYDLPSLVRGISQFLTNYDRQGTNGLSSGASYLALGRYLFDPAQNHKNLQIALYQLGFSNDDLIAIDRVLFFSPTSDAVVTGTSGQVIYGLGSGGTIFLDSAAPERLARELIATPLANDYVAQALNGELTKIVASIAPAQTITQYLDSVLPAALSFRQYAPALLAGMAYIWQLPNNVSGDLARLESILQTLGVNDLAAFETEFHKGVFGTDFTPPSATSGRAFLNMFARGFNPQRGALNTPDAYANFRAFLTVKETSQSFPSLTATQLTWLDRVLGGPLDAPSGVLDANGQPINGLGGKTIYQ